MNAPETPSWRATGNEIKFWIFDWKLSLFLSVILLRMFEVWPYVLIGIALPFFAYLNKIGYNLSNFYRLMSSKIVGKKAHGKPFWFRRK